MNLPITAHVVHDGKWFVAFCAEFPEANGQGLTRDECIADLMQAIELLMEDRREDARRRIPIGAELVQVA